LPTRVCVAFRRVGAMTSRVPWGRVSVTGPVASLDAGAAVAATANQLRSVVYSAGWTAREGRVRVVLPALRRWGRRFRQSRC
jgi:hypothetical protein